MIKKESNKEEKFYEKAVFYGLIIIILHFDAIITLFRAGKKGATKKEVLTINSKEGFDFDIIIK